MYQPNYHPKSKAANIYENLLDEKNKQAAIQAKTDEMQEIQESVKEEAVVSNTWKKIQAERQNRTPTLIEVESDEELEVALLSSPAIPPSPIILNYKLIGIDKVEQLNYFKTLVDPSLKKRWIDQTKTIKLRGILAEANQQKIGLILADIFTNHRVAEIISLNILPEYPDDKIGAKLIECLRTSLPKINCDRLKLNPQAEVIINKMQISI